MTGLSLNAPEQGLLIRKLDATTRQNLEGVSFEVRFLGTADSPNGTTNDPRTYVTDANGLIYLPDCEPGWYQITKTAVPDGYHSLLSEGFIFFVCWEGGWQGKTRSIGCEGEASCLIKL